MSYDSIERVDGVYETIFVIKFTNSITPNYLPDMERICATIENSRIIDKSCTIDIQEKR